MPLVLIVAFVLTGGVLLYTTVAQYLFEEAVSTQLGEVRHVAEIAAAHAGARLAANRCGSSMPASGRRCRWHCVPAGLGARLERAGPWEHAAPPVSIPSWIARTGHFVGATVVSDARQPDGHLVVLRAVAPVGDGGLVVADVPLDASLVNRLHRDSGARLRSTDVQKCGGAGPSAPAPVRNVWTPFRETMAFMDCTAWEDGGGGTIAMTLDAPLVALSNRLASVHSSEIAATIGQSWWTVLVQLLVLLAVLFLIIQGSALVVGGVLARSITSAVHELFIGTERVRQGDFAHRIPIASRDQLGELAESFNRMSGSIEQLLHVQREKQRLDDELRIARDIQRSLLPARLPATAGLDVADLCEPAREVGGDYYDFFELSPTSLGVLIADVAGKGHVGGAVHGRDEGADAGAQPRRAVAATTAD